MYWEPLWLSSFWLYNYYLNSEYLRFGENWASEDFPVKYCNVLSDGMLFLLLFGNVTQLRIGINIQQHLSKYYCAGQRAVMCVQSKHTANYVEHPIPKCPVMPCRETHSAYLRELFAQEGLSKVQNKIYSPVDNLKSKSGCHRLDSWAYKTLWVLTHIDTFSDSQQSFCSFL